MRRRATKTYYDSELYNMQEHPKEKPTEIGRTLPYHLQYMRNMKKKEGKENDCSNDKG